VQYAVEFWNKLATVRPELGKLDITRRKRVRETLLVDSALAISAARFNLPPADSLIYATVQRFSATLWTQDEHFAQLPGVRFFPR